MRALSRQADVGTHGAQGNAPRLTSLARRRQIHYDSAVRIFIEHDAATLARLTGAPRPACESIIVEHGNASNVLASVLAGNPLGGDWLFDVDSPGDRIVSWSGTLAEGLFESDPRTWGRPGREALSRFCDEIGVQLKSHQRRLCFHPHARHALNDIPSCLTFLRDRSSLPFDIALAPASLLVPSMLDRLEDHLQRHFESLGAQCAIVLLSDVRVVDAGDDESRCEPSLLGEGLLPRDLVRSLLSAHVPPATPIVVDGRQGSGAIARQLEWLAG